MRAVLFASVLITFGTGVALAQSPAASTQMGAQEKLHAKAATTLQEGEYVVEDTPCDQASAATRLIFDGHKFTSEHGYCVIMDGPTARSKLKVKPCVDGDDASGRAEAFSVFSSAKFSMSSTAFRLCKSSEAQKGTPEKLHVIANAAPPDSFVSLRTDPSLKTGKRITAMPNGTIVQVLEKNPDGWWKVRVDSTGEEGWALSGQNGKVWITCCAHSAQNQKTAPLASQAGPQPTNDGSRDDEARGVIAKALRHQDQLDERYRATVALQMGEYVKDRTKCEDASMATRLIFDGSKFTGGHGYCVQLVGPASGPTFKVKPCTKGSDQDADASGRDGVFTLKTPTEFSTAFGGTYRLCGGNPQMASNVASSLTPLKWEVTCNRLIMTWGKSNVVVNVSERAIFLQDAFVAEFAKKVISETTKRCGYALRSVSFVTSDTLGQAVLYGDWSAENPNWKMTNFVKAAAKRTQISDQKQRLRENFMSQNGVVKFARPDQLVQNPFVFKGTIVGVRADFQRMIGENEAVFRLASAFLDLTKVPSTEFHGNEQLFLAVRVNGIKDGMPSGEFIGAYRCTRPECSEFY